MVLTDELIEATAIATAGAAGGKNLGSRIQTSRIREVYWIKIINRHTATNTIRIQERATGGSPRLKDLWTMPTGDYLSHPDELKENSLPIYVIRTDTASVKYMRATCDNGGAFIRILYRDLP